MKRLILLLVLLACEMGHAQTIRLGPRISIHQNTGPVNPFITTAVLGDGVEDQLYPSVQLEATGGTEPYVWSTSMGAGLADDTDCAGLALSAGGLISGTPTDNGGGTCSFTVLLTDDNALTDTQPLTITIAASGAGGLPSGWTFQDIGLPGNAVGTVVYDDNGAMGMTTEDIVTLTSTAPNVTGTSDNAATMCSTISGDGYIEAEVTAFTGYTFAQAGVMIRKDLTSGAPMMFNFTFPIGGGLTNQRKYRLAASGTAVNDASAFVAHYWLRIIRLGDVVTSYISTTGDPQEWFQVSTSQTVDLDTSAYYCLAVTSIPNQVTVADADFENIVVSDQPPIAPEDADYGGYRPHYQGFGATSLGGSGDTTKVICAVNSRLATTGAPTLVSSGFYRGTFNQCVTGIDSSYVVFEVSGYIELGGCRTISNRYLTIAGQTAPAPGVALRNGCIYNNAPDIVWQHMRLRCGAAQGTVSMYIGIPPTGASVFNIVMDHVSISWCGASQIGINSVPNPQDILVVDSILGHGLAINPSSLGMLMYGMANSTATIARNYYVHNGNRSPYIGSGWRASIYNNYVYNPVTVAGSDGQFGFTQVIGFAPYPPSIIETAYIGNVYQNGPATVSPDGFMKVIFDMAQVNAGGADIYLLDNVGQGTTGTSGDSQWSGVTFQSPATRANSECNQACFDSTFTWHHAFNYDILSSAAVETFIDDNVGAWPTNRDALDVRILGDKDDNGTSYITNESQVGGFAAVPLTETTQTFTVPMNPHSAGNCGNFQSGTARPVIMCTLENDATYGARRLEPRWD